MTSSREVTCLKRAVDSKGKETHITHLGGPWGADGAAKCECLVEVHAQLDRGVDYWVPDKVDPKLRAHVEKDGEFVRTGPDNRKPDNLDHITARCIVTCECGRCTPRPYSSRRP